MFAVVIPSRGRPAQASALVERIARTSKARALVVVDDDDPQRDGYEWLTDLLICPTSQAPGSHVRAINAGARWVIDEWGATTVAKLDDDHWPIVDDWDSRLLAEQPGIVYANDGHRPDLPTAPAISARIIDALGWMALPTLQHMLCDDVWRDLGTAAGCLRFVDEVLIEHRHPNVTGAAPDEHYLRSWDSGRWQRDRVAARQWRAIRKAADVAKVRAAL